MFTYVIVMICIGNLLQVRRLSSNGKTKMPNVENVGGLVRPTTPLSAKEAITFLVFVADLLHDNAVLLVRLVWNFLCALLCLTVVCLGVQTMSQTQQFEFSNLRASYYLNIVRKYGNSHFHTAL